MFNARADTDQNVDDNRLGQARIISSYLTGNQTPGSLKDVPFYFEIRNCTRLTLRLCKSLLIFEHHKKLHSLLRDRIKLCPRLVTKTKNVIPIRKKNIFARCIHS